MTGTINYDAVRTQADEFRRQDAATGEPAHIAEMRRPVPQQQEIDRVSAHVLRATSISDDEWDALVRHARDDAEREGDWPETRLTLEKLGKLVGKDVE